VQRATAANRQAQLGDGFRWREIYELNKSIIANPDLICTG
jgi:nucleoid-associated protein YgaU